MDLYLFNSAEWERLYNCSMYSVDQIPLERRQHIWLGTANIVLFLVMLILYLPCLAAIAKHLEQSCYKIMFFIGVTDVGCLWISGLLTGVLGIQGAVFCSHPRLIYLAGVSADIFWFIESSTSMFLAANRCIELAFPSTGELLFRGRRTWLWLLVPLCYSLLFGFFQLPVLFTGLFYSWFLNPHVGYIDAEFDAANFSIFCLGLHNGTTMISLVSFYAAFMVIMFLKHNIGGGTTVEITAAQKKTFVQVFLISMINFTAAFIYVYMQLFYVNQVIIVVAEFGWLFAHGIPPFIYLAFNATIRSDCRRMVFGKWGRVRDSQANFRLSSAVNPSVSARNRTGTAVQAC